MDTKNLKNSVPLMLAAGVLVVIVAAASTAILTRQDSASATDETEAELSSQYESRYEDDAPSARIQRYTATTLPAGTPIAIRLGETLSTASTAPGEAFTARVVSPVVVDGRTVIPAGAIVSGVVRESARSKRIGGRARLSIELTGVNVGGVHRPLSADYTVLGKKQTKRDAATIGGATAGGALLGRIIGHKRGDEAKGTVAGAVVGGAVGTGVALSNRAPNVTLPAGSTIQVRLDSAVTV